MHLTENEEVAARVEVYVDDYGVLSGTVRAGAQNIFSPEELTAVDRNGEITKTAAMD